MQTSPNLPQVSAQTNPLFNSGSYLQPHTSTTSVIYAIAGMGRVVHGTQHITWYLQNAL